MAENSKSYDHLNDDRQKRLLTSIYTRAVHADGNLSQLLHDFEQFSDEYFTYFEEAIAQGKCENEGISDTYVRFHALENINREWTILSQVVAQRDFINYREWLNELDQLASKN